MNLEERFDDHWLLFRGNKDLWLSFFRKEIENCLDGVVPDENEPTIKDCLAVQAKSIGYNSCRKEVLNKINQIKKSL